MKQVLSAFFLLLLCLGSVSGASASGNSLYSEARMDAKELKQPEGAVLPVYSAPDEKAYRGADGRACVSLREEVTVLDSIRYGTWTLIEYDVSENEKRIGWIRTAQDAPEVKWSIYDWLSIEDVRKWGDESEEARAAEQAEDQNYLRGDIRIAEPGKVVRDTTLTDDPRGGKRKIRNLKKGEYVGILYLDEFDEDDEWTYVITTVDGKKACGFIPSDAAEYHNPVHMEGSTLVCDEGVEFIGREHPDYDYSIYYRGNGPVLSKAEYGMVQLETLSPPRDVNNEEVRKIRLPSTLRLMGDFALCDMSLDELVIPEGTEYITGLAALATMDIGTLYLPSTLRRFECCSLDSFIRRYEVDSRNPFIKSVDGVVYSKDGKTLLKYPDDQKRLHYDVLKGTEEIYDMAFYLERLYTYDDSLPITSLSLPAGLRRIGARAFYGLDNLVSLTIPPTVVEIGPGALEPMFSLTRLSIPERLRDAVDEELRMKLREEKYNGDNGNLVEKEKEMW